MGGFAVILPAAGRSTRFGHPTQKKTYAEIDGRAVWLRAADAFLGRPDVDQIIVAIAAEDRELFERRYHANVAFLGFDIVEGGAERFDTIARALAQVSRSCEFVAIHDAARPCLTTEQVDAVFGAARQHGAAILALPVADTLKRVGPDGMITETISRAGLYAAQTPQVFRRDLIVQAYAQRGQLTQAITDDAQLVEALGHPCAIVEGSPMNLKITTQADLRLASLILQANPKPQREGSIHPFAEDDPGWADEPRRKLEDLF